MSDCSDMEYSSDNECEYDDYYNTGKYMREREREAQQYHPIYQ